MAGQNKNVLPQQNFVRSKMFKISHKKNAKNYFIMHMKNYRCNVFAKNYDESEKKFDSIAT